MTSLLQSDSDDGCNIGKFFDLTYEQRFMGFAISSALGLICSFIGTMLMFSLNFAGFAVMYSFGNVCMIIATLFLFGPVKQFKSMFESWHMGIATGVFVLMIIMTLVAAFHWESVILCILFIVLQFIAYVWYVVNSIPGGRKMCELCLPV